MMVEPRISTLVRLPAPLRDAMRELALANRRSVTREIQVALEQHIATAAPPPAQAES